MTANELKDLIVLETYGLLDEDSEYVPYINNAIELLGFFLASMGDPEMIAMRDIDDGDEVPEDFINFLPANGYPINILAGKFKIINGDSSCTDVKYTVSKPRIKTLEDTIPYKDMYTGCLQMIASYLVKKHSYITPAYCQQDNEFVKELMTAIKGAKGVA